MLCTAVPGAPSAPTAVDVLATSMKILWNAPSKDGGTPIIGYHVERRSKISKHWVFLNKDPVPDTSLVVKDLFEDTVYEYRVTAVNKMGAGKPSDPSPPITARNPWSQSLIHLIFLVLRPHWAVPDKFQKGSKTVVCVYVHVVVRLISLSH